MSVRVIPVGMAQTAPIVSTATHAPARLASVASTVRSTPTTALTGSSKHCLNSFNHQTCCVVNQKQV